MSLLRQVLLKTSTVKHSSNTVQHTLQTLRYKPFAKAGYITTERRKPILNRALAMQQRSWLQGLWDAINESSSALCGAPHKAEFLHRYETATLRKVYEKTKEGDVRLYYVSIASHRPSDPNACWCRC